jgi:hypothetical protein
LLLEKTLDNSQVIKHLDLHLKKSVIPLVNPKSILIPTKRTLLLKLTFKPEHNENELRIILIFLSVSMSFEQKIITLK